MLLRLSRDIYYNQAKIHELGNGDLKLGLRKFLSERSGVPEDSFTDWELYDIATDTLVELADKSALRDFFKSLMYRSGMLFGEGVNLDVLTRRALATLAVIPKNRVVPHE